MRGSFLGRRDIVFHLLNSEKIKSITGERKRGAFRIFGALAMKCFG